MGQITKPINNEPKNIYLQIGDDVDPELSFEDLDFSCITWSTERNLPNDIAYTSNAAVVERLRDIQNDFDRGAYHRAYETLRSTIKDLEP